VDSLKTHRAYRVHHSFPFKSKRQSANMTASRNKSVVGGRWLKPCQTQVVPSANLAIKHGPSINGHWFLEPEAKQKANQNVHYNPPPGFFINFSDCHICVSLKKSVSHKSPHLLWQVALQAGAVMVIRLMRAKVASSDTDEHERLSMNARHETRVQSVSAWGCGA
jgi:hypothetical protein